MLPRPLRWFITPVCSIERDGEQDPATWKFEKRIPAEASASMFGVANSEPKEPTSEKPQSSASRMTLRSEEHTTELQSLMRITYAVICLKTKINTTHQKKKAVENK